MARRRLMGRRLSEIDWERIEHRRWIKQLEGMIRRMILGIKYVPAPPDPGFRPGGIRERAMKALHRR